MKKFLVSAILFLFAFGFTNAQTAAPAAKATTKTKVTSKKTTVATSSKSEVKFTPPVIKKDGTPDMRYKANKMAKEGPKKKDGTPDMRYKQNKKK